ncbi:MAG TPA: phosphopantetheine-binding protein [Actinomycetota bacterium]|jgi:acyl carrier protein
MTTDIQAELTSFLTTEVLEDVQDLSPDQPLLTGLLDSFGLLALLNFIEERFGVAIPHDEVVTENFSSVSALAAFVGSKQTAAATN